MKLLIEVESRDEFESLIVDLEWKMRNWKLDDDTIDKYKAAARTSVEMERERCANVCESSAKRYEELAIAARESRGPLSNSEANEYMWAAECARQQAKQIRGAQ